MFNVTKKIIHLVDWIDVVCMYIIISLRFYSILLFYFSFKDSICPCFLQEAMCVDYD